MYESLRDGVQTTIYVAGLMEKVRTPTGVVYHYYIPAGSHTVVYNRWCDGTTNTFYVTGDHLGSTSSVTCGLDVTGCASGNLFVQECRACGRRPDRGVRIDGSGGSSNSGHAGDSSAHTESAAFFLPPALICVEFVRCIEQSDI